jgi:hypothetical protein
MSAIVLVHLGRRLPAHFEYCVAQARISSPTIPIHILCDRPVVRTASALLSAHDVEVHDLGAYRNNKLWNEFVPMSELDVSTSWWTPRYRWDPRRLNKYAVPAEFWRYTTERLFAVNAFLSSTRLTDVFHFDNDVLVYEDLAGLSSKVASLYPRLAATPYSQREMAAGMLFIRDASDLEHMCEWIVHELPEKKKQWSKTQGQFVGDMTLLFDYHSRYDADYLAFLPILPEGPHAQGVRELGGIFDPLSWGQFVDGTPSPHHDPKGYIIPRTYIGRELSDGRHEVIWKTDEQGRMVPFVATRGTHATKLLSLHLHSKRLQHYLSSRALDGV